jgi:Tol biopolymer transport system component
MATSGQADDERTVITSPPRADTTPKKRSPWLWVGLGGCGGLLCLALLGVAGYFIIGRGAGGPVAVVTQIVSGPKESPTEVTPTIAPTEKPTATKVAAKPTATKGLPKPQTKTPEATETPGGRLPTVTPSSGSQKPAVGPIVFATSITADNQPVGANTTFPNDVEEIHAIFSYEGMSESDTWERHWYQDGEEVGSGSGAWDAGENGTFDLSLTGGGEPLGAGSWKLEIYVNGELAQTGTFVIQASTTPTAQAGTGSSAVGGKYQIAFARWDGGKHNLYIANTDGSGERFLLESASGPSWSPNGQYLSIFGEQGIATQVRDGVPYYREDLTDGILVVKVANFPSDITQVEIEQKVRDGTARWTAWAPSGEMLAFDATRGSPDRRIYFLGTADNQQYNIEIPGEQADWSPNSNQIVYRSGRDGKQGIWISNRDDSGAHNITNEGSDSLPGWSSDGRKIAFHRDSGGNVDIYVMNVDGSNIRRLTDAPGPDTLPTWTPDGRIVFRSARTGSWGIYIMNADGSDQRQIIANADPGPDWTFGRMDVH